MLLGWLVTLVTGCLKMEAVCLTGSDVFKSGLPLKMKDREGRGGQGGWERTVSARGHVGQRMYSTIY